MAAYSQPPPAASGPVPDSQHIRPDTGRGLAVRCAVAGGDLDPVGLDVLPLQLDGPNPAETRCGGSSSCHRLRHSFADMAGVPRRGG